MRKFSVLLLALLLVLGLALVGCGDDDSKDSDDDSTNMVEETTDETAEADTEVEESDAATEAEAGDETAPEETAAVALTINGSVENEMTWTEDEVRALDTLDAESTNSKGETETYTGVSLNALLELAAPAQDAETLTLVGETEAEVSLAEITACADCILSFRNMGGFSAVLPGFDKDAQVKGVTEVIVK